MQGKQETGPEYSQSRPFVFDLLRLALYRVCPLNLLRQPELIADPCL